MKCLTFSDCRHLLSSLNTQLHLQPPMQTLANWKGLFFLSRKGEDEKTTERYEEQQCCLLGMMYNNQCSWGVEGLHHLLMWNCWIQNSSRVFMPLCTIQVGEQNIPARPAQIEEFTSCNSDGWSLIMSTPTILCCAARLHMDFYIMSVFISFWKLQKIRVILNVWWQLSGLHIKQFNIRHE